MRSVSVLTFFVLFSAALFTPCWHVFSMGSAVLVTSTSQQKTEASPDLKVSSHARDAFGRLPLSFEVNRGQTDSQVLFLTRGQDYGLFLTADGAVFSFNGVSVPLRIRFQGASTTPHVSGLDELPGKVNYLVGSKSDQWRTNISTYAQVRYEGIYDGIDLVYYGNQRQLEYDFEVAPHARFKQIRLAFEGGTLKLSRGDLVWQTGSRKLSFLRPRAYQEIRGRQRTVAAQYVLTSDGQVSFQIGNYDRTHPLIIDPRLSYSSYAGGSGFDEARSITVDSSGNAYIAGQTFSTNFPAVPSVPAKRADAFVTKLNATGTSIIYSTIIGGSGADIAKSIASDTSGNAYVVGQTSSSDFPVFTALHPFFGGVVDGFVLELNASGSAPVYSTYLGGHGNDVASGIVVDSSGNAYVSGSTSSSDFPTTNPLQAHRAGNSIFKTTNAAGNWAPSDSGFTSGTISDLVFDPSNPSIMYAASIFSVFKSTDGGANWNALGGQTGATINKLAIPPNNSNIIYAATDIGMFKSTDGGNSFTEINNGINPTFVRSVAIDPVTPTTIYAAGIGNFVFKSIDGGATWVQKSINFVSIINSFLIDPNTPATIYAATDSGVFKSTNAADTWTASNAGIPFLNLGFSALALDTTNNLLYASGRTGIFKSSNAAVSWTSINGNLPQFSLSLVAPDPTNASIIYAVSNGQLFKTSDAGVTWTLSNAGIANFGVAALLVHPTQPATLYLASSSGSDAFVTKFAAGGSSQIYSTFLGGNFSDSANDIAIDASGNAYIVGSAGSSDFPTMNAIQPIRDQNSNDGFVAKLNATGSALVYSTYLGGNSTDIARAIAVDGSGNAYITGLTASSKLGSLRRLSGQ